MHWLSYKRSFAESKLMRIMGLSILATLALVANQAQATQITYSITGNGFYDNPMGSFTYDAKENKYSSVSIWSLGYYGSASGGDTVLASTGSLFGTKLWLEFHEPLSYAGGNVGFSGYEKGLLTFFGRVKRSGTINGPVGVPEPGALLLLGAGLVGLGFLRRRSNATSE